MNIIETYDPNVDFSTNTKVRVTLQCWDYKKECDIVIGGNARGFDVIAAACEGHMLVRDGLFEEIEDGDVYQIILTNSKGENLMCVEYSLGALEQYVVGAHIVEVRK